MSGFFMLPRSTFDAGVRGLSGQGFKILLDLLTSVPRQLRIKELPYQFGERRFGESKLDTRVAWEFLMLIADKLFGHIVPVRFILFAFIGGFGLVIHLAVLGFFFKILGLSLVAAQTVATLLAMTSNFFLNNLFTYRDMRIKGWRILRGLLSFYGVCALGAVGNVGIASYVFAADQRWWVAGIAGVLVGAVWNYAVSSVFTWRV
jgi:dolichol-phosphate mannosyltransferase